MQAMRKRITYDAGWDKQTASALAFGGTNVGDGIEDQGCVGAGVVIAGIMVVKLNGSQTSILVGMSQLEGQTKK